MNFKNFMVVLGGVCLAAVLVFTWGCQNSPTGPVVSGPTDPARLRAYSSGSCTSGSFSVSFSNANFVTGLGWRTGSSRSISFSGSCSGCNWGPGVYGWWRNPLVEYYIGKSGGTNRGSYNCDGNSYTINVSRRYGQPSIDGTADFDQYNINGPRTGTKDMGCHFNAWNAGSHDYMVVMVEGWSNNSGSASVSVPNSNWYTNWTNGGSANFTCGGGGGGTTSTTTTTSGGGTTTTTSGGGGGTSILVRARGTTGEESIDVRVDGNTITTWTLGTGMGNWETSTQYSGGLTVCFTNDSGDRDVQIDYVEVGGSRRQSENQSYNTGVWQDGSCGGSNSEWLHCNGCIGYGDVSGGGGGTTTTAATTTTTSGSSWWGGGSWW